MSNHDIFWIQLQRSDEFPDRFRVTGTALENAVNGRFCDLSFLCQLAWTEELLCHFSLDTLDVVHEPNIVLNHSCVKHCFRYIVRIFDNPAVKSGEVKAVLKLVGERIRSHREVKGWSQEGLADAASIPRNKYGAIERADRHYRVDALIRVLDALDIDVLELFKPREMKPAAHSTKHDKNDPIRQLAIEQLEQVLDEGSEEDIQIAIGSVSRWHKALPKRR